MRRPFLFFQGYAGVTIPSGLRGYLAFTVKRMPPYQACQALSANRYWSVAARTNRYFVRRAVDSFEVAAGLVRRFRRQVC